MSTALNSQKVFIMSFCKGRIPHKSVNLSFIITHMKNKLTDLCGNRLLPNDIINAFCERRLRRANRAEPCQLKHIHVQFIKSDRARERPFKAKSGTIL